MSDRLPYEDQRSARRKRSAARKKKGGGIVEYLVILAVSFALVFGFVGRSWWRRSGSLRGMIPTLQINDRVLVKQVLSTASRSPLPRRHRRLRSVDDPDTDLIKRVVALPGDRLAVRSGRLIVNGEPQREPFTNEKFPDKSFFAATTIRRTTLRDGRQPVQPQDSRVSPPAQEEHRGRGLPALLAAGQDRPPLAWMGRPGDRRRPC